MFGVDGYNLPLQIANTTIPCPFTFLQAVLINIGIIYLVFLAMIGLTLLLSAQMKSPYSNTQRCIYGRNTILLSNSI